MKRRIGPLLIAAVLTALASMAQALTPAALEAWLAGIPIRAGYRGKGISRALAKNPIPIVDGFAAVPQEPGLGVEPNPDVIEKYLVRG